MPLCREILRVSCYLLLAGFMLASCSPELSLEQQIVATLRNMEAHIEAGERREFMNYVADDFRGQGGELNHDQLNALLLYQLRRYQKVHAQLLPITVTPAGLDEAEARFQVLLTGGAGVLPESGRLYQVTSMWRYQDGEWVLQSAQWQAAGMTGN